MYATALLVIRQRDYNKQNMSGPRNRDTLYIKEVLHRKGAMSKANTSEATIANSATETGANAGGVNNRLSNLDRLDKVRELCKSRGFVFPSSEIYGGLASAYDWAPLGALMVEKIKALWTQEIARKNHNVVLYDGSIVSPVAVWKASGHVDAFNDPLVEDLVTHQRHRADHLIAEALGVDTSTLTFDDMNRLIKEKGLKSPQGNPISEVKSFNLLVTAKMGSGDEASKQDVILRGETCQAIFVNFSNIAKAMRKAPPFGVLQIGKAFRNEVTVKQFLLRVREFEQMEFEFFFDPADGKEWYEIWQEKFFSLLTGTFGLPKDKLRLRELPPEERSHYAKAQGDIEFRLPNGDWIELSPMNHRGDYDLSRHAEFSGKNLSHFDQATNKHFVPNVIETSFGVGRLFYVLMDNFLREEEVPGTNESRTVLALPKLVAPYRAAVLPLSKKPELEGISTSIFQALAEHMDVDYDHSGSIGKRYRRQDEIGTPFCVTVDFQSLEDNAVTIRDRDSMKQDRVPVENVVNYIQERSK
jgi:glycyl-tRNA synthetase